MPGPVLGSKDGPPGGGGQGEGGTAEGHHGPGGANAFSGSIIKQSSIREKGDRRRRGGGE